mmetsp:Transcript_26798/g.25663  ORF Transcript_26798/g.25663 Transcript_26798/m.25663 type:complete len:106 (-) Transcript_26798:183-500(-)
MLRQIIRNGGNGILKRPLNSSQTLNISRPLSQKNEKKKFKEGLMNIPQEEEPLPSFKGTNIVEDRLWFITNPVLHALRNYKPTTKLAIVVSSYISVNAVILYLFI